MALVKSMAGNEICDTVARNAQVGGRNYITRSARLEDFGVEASRATFKNQVFTRSSGSAGSNYGIYKDAPLTAKAGDNLTLSVDVADIFGTMRIGLCETNQLTYPWNDAVKNIATNGRHSISVNFTGSCTIRVYIASNEAGTTCKLSNVKLERGNKATDWTPALEDTLTMTDDNNGNVTISIL